MSEGHVGVRDPNAFLPPLESMRGWAIILVVLFHYHGVLFGDAQPSTDMPLWRSIFIAGNSGVNLFFVLSGFLLSQPFIRSLQGGVGVDVGRYFWARFLRIIPLYYLVVLAAWLLSGNWAALKGLIFIPLGFEVFPYSVVWWSLSTEVQFYLALPLLMLPLLHRYGRYVVALALVAWLGAYLYYFHQPAWLGDHTKRALQFSLFGRLPTFLVGVAAAWLVSQPVVVSCLRRQVLAWALMIGSGGALLLMWSWAVAVGGKNAEFALPTYHAVEALLWGGVMLGLLNVRGWLTWLMSNPLFDHFGRISYSLYLVHLPVQIFILAPIIMGGGQGHVDFQAAETIWRLVASALAAWALACLCYWLVEKPFLRLKSSLLVFRRPSSNVLAQ